MKKTDYDKFSDFLNIHKMYVGFSDWEIKLGMESKDLGSRTFAEVLPNIYEKSLLIELSESFMKETTSKQANILLHELVHARIFVKDKKLEEFNDIEEEHLANDLTRGFEFISGGGLDL